MMSEYVTGIPFHTRDSISAIDITNTDSNIAVKIVPIVIIYSPFVAM